MMYVDLAGTLLLMHGVFASLITYSYLICGALPQGHGETPRGQSDAAARAPDNLERRPERSNTRL